VCSTEDKVILRKFQAKELLTGAEEGRKFKKKQQQWWFVIMQKASLCMPDQVKARGECQPIILLWQGIKVYGHHSIIVKEEPELLDC